MNSEHALLSSESQYRQYLLFEDSSEVCVYWGGLVRSWLGGGKMAAWHRLEDQLGSEGDNLGNSTVSFKLLLLFC